MSINLTSGWTEDQQAWLKQHREKQEPDLQTNKLISERVNQYLRDSKDKIIKQPGLFIRDLNAILKDLQPIKHGAAERLKHEIVLFLNDFQAKARKGEAVVPASFQRTSLMDAAEFDIYRHNRPETIQCF